MRRSVGVDLVTEPDSHDRRLSRSSREGADNASLEDEGACPRNR
jgi:hypothetical protein